jgi:hypothetical protein
MAAETHNRHEEYLHDTVVSIMHISSLSMSKRLTIDELNSFRNNTLHLLCNVPDKSSVRVWMHSFLELVIHSVDLKKSVATVLV